MKGGDIMGSVILARVPRGSSEYQQRLVTCGKSNCGRCPHGPYWYLVVRLRRGGSVRRYIGKEAPADLTDAELDSVGISRRAVGVTQPAEAEEQSGE